MSTAIESERSRPDTQPGQARGRIGWFLVWAVVFADLGTSVYYTPGILFSHSSVGRHTALFVAPSQLAVVLAVIVHVGPIHLLAALPRVLSGPHLTTLGVLTGYAAAFLAFSGLETFSQVSAAMAEPRRHVARWAMRLLVATMLLTSPLLTLWSTTVLPVTGRTDPNQFISLLGGYAAGRLL